MITLAPVNFIGHFRVMPSTQNIKSRTFTMQGWFNPVLIHQLVREVKRRIRIKTLLYCNCALLQKTQKTDISACLLCFICFYFIVPIILFISPSESTMMVLVLAGAAYPKPSMYALFCSFTISVLVLASSSVR